MAARRILYNMEAVQGVGIGPVIKVDNASRITYWVVGSFSATLALEGSPDGVNWRQLTAFTSPFHSTFSDAAMFVRVNTTVYTSGTPLALLTVQISS